MAKAIEVQPQFIAGEIVRLRGSDTLIMVITPIKGPLDPDFDRGFFEGALISPVTNPNYGRILYTYKGMCYLESNIQVLLNQEVSNDWVLEKADRYYYLNGRNGRCYCEVSYWYDKHTLERKETFREVEIEQSRIGQLPDWAKSITERRKDLDVVW